MGNRKFYYHSKNVGSKPKKNGENGAAASSEAVQKYTFEQLATTLEGLKLSDTTKELLSKYNIKTAADLVKRTEREMYKVQSLNKKILTEIKSSLDSCGMSFRSEDSSKAKGQRSDGIAKTSQPQSDRDGRRDRQLGGESAAKGRPSDRKNNDSAKVKAANQKLRAEKPQEKRLTEPLPVDEWRKIQKGGKWGFYDGFKTVIPAMYDEVFCFKDGLAAVELDEKCGYIDKDNNIVIPLDYDTAMSFSEGYASVVKGDKCGYINKNNEVIIPFIYDAATPFEGGEAKVKKDGKWGTIIPDGAVKWI